MSKSLTKDIPVYTASTGVAFVCVRCGGIFTCKPNHVGVHRKYCDMCRSHVLIERQRGRNNSIPLHVHYQTARTVIDNYLLNNPAKNPTYLKVGNILDWMEESPEFNPGIWKTERIRRRFLSETIKKYYPYKRYYYDVYIRVGEN